MPQSVTGGRTPLKVVAERGSAICVGGDRHCSVCPDAALLCSNMLLCLQGMERMIRMLSKAAVNCMLRGTSFSPTREWGTSYGEKETMH